MAELVKTRFVPLDEVAEFIRGITFKPGDIEDGPTDTNVDCLRTKNVQSSLDTRDVWAIDKSFVKRPNQYVIEGDILISSANSWNLVGKCSWIPKLARPTSFGGFVTVLRRRSKSVDPRYLFHWFSSAQVQRTIRSFGNQTTNISNLDLKRTASLKLPLPPIDEQRRLVAVLDRADELRTKRSHALAHLDSLKRSIFHSMFGDVSINDKEWEQGRKLADIAMVSSGITKGRKTSGKELTMVPYMAVSNVQDMSLNLRTVKHIGVTTEEIDRLRLVRDDLLLTEGGDPDKLGRGALWADELPLSIHQNHVFRVRVIVKKEIHPVFLNWLVSSARGKSYFLKSAKQTTGIASINMTQLKAFPLLVPPFSLQLDFAKRVAAVHRIEQHHRAQLAELDTLVASLQYRAFLGELS
jgi:type I restriction enzyme S subunit